MRLSSNSLHFQLLSYSIHGDKALALKEVAQLIKENSINWEEVYLRAEMNAIRPQLYNLLKPLGPELVPPIFLDKLGLAVRENLYNQLQNTAEYLQVKERLDAAGITAVLFKGLSLAAQFYDNPSDRESVDVDLFVEATEVEKIKPLMRERGYVPEPPLDELTDTYIFGELCEYNFDKYLGEERIFHFEFHWRLSMTVFGMNIQLRELLPQVTTAVIQHRTVPVFTASAHLLLVIMHHGGKDQFMQMKQLLDISRILAKDSLIDWPWLIRQSEKFNVDKVLYVAVNICSKITGINIPVILSEKVSSKKIDGLARNRIRRMKNKKDRMENFRNRLDDLYFQLRTRENLILQAKMVQYEIRRNLLPGLVPGRFHQFLMSKKIRKETSNPK